MSITRRAMAGGAAAAVLTLGAAGTAGAARVHTTAATAPSTAQLALSATVSAAGAGSETVQGTGQVDFAHQQAALFLTLPGGLLGSGSTDVRAVVDGTNLYVSVPALSSLLGGADWLKMSDPSGTSGGGDGFAQAAAELADAQGMVTTLQSDGATVTPLGTRTAAGQTETGWRADVDVAKLLAAQGVGSAAAQKATAAVGTTIPVTIWADPAGRLAELSTAVHATSSSSQTADVSVTLDVTGYDAPVSITVPPASSTKSLPSGVLQQLSPMVRGQLGMSAGTTAVFSKMGAALLGHQVKHPGAKHHHRHA